MPLTAKQSDEIDPDDRLLTEKESAARLGVGWPLWTRVRDQIEYVRFGKYRRYTPRALARFQRQRTVKPRTTEEVA